MAKKFQHVRGMPDILPEQQQAHQYLTDTFRHLAGAAGFEPIELPIMEEKEVFVRSVGEGTDVVDKELYAFTDRSDKEVALRPEPTAGMVRAYIEHGMASLPQPVRLMFAGPVFRYDRPQAGRQRQFNQLGVEVIGDGSPSIEAHIMMLAMRFYRMIGLRNVTLQLNSLGDQQDRKDYLKALTAYLKDYESELPEVDRKRLKSNPLRVLDSKERATKKIVAQAPQILNYLSESSKQHFEAVLEYLDAMQINYELNPLLVRGLDYYTHTVFEFYGEREGSQSSLGAGGRYDNLVQQLGGSKPTPAAGFGIGLERVLLELKEEGVELPQEHAVKVYVASLGEPARIGAFALIEQLLDSGVGAVGAVDRDGIGPQLERANKLNVPYAIIIGQKEIQEETVILRDMRSGAQEMIPLGSVVKELEKRKVGL
ncbi:histidine--tRNA ligase [Patescibacteria group bacterium]|nr:MAG: histidine--tRNA ligase [Patescibacteria group bacterium]